MTNQNPLSRGALILLFVCFTLAWFGTLDYRKLVGPDEGRYGEIPREMVATGDWTTPRLNGLKYFEKPALQYWATAAAFEVFGEHNWTVRLWPALTGYLSILLAAFASRRLFGSSAGLLGAAILGSCLWQVLIGHIATLDMGTSFFLQLALTGFIFANWHDTPENKRRPWMMLTWGALALAMLTKGLIALVLPGGTLVIYTLLTRDFTPWRRLELPRGLALFTLIALPWFVAVSLANPEFPHFFFWHEHFERFLTKVHRRYQPWWYFMPILAIGFLPWTLLVLHSWFGSFDRQVFGQRGPFRPRTLLVAWSLAIFLFFSASSSKLPSYILPMFPALAMLAGGWLAGVTRRTLIFHLTVIAGLAVLALGLLPLASQIKGLNAEDVSIQHYLQWLYVAAGLWLAGAVGGLVLALRHRLLPAILITALGTFVANNLVLLGHENLSHTNTAYYLAEELAPQLPPGVPFYSIGYYEQTLPFYLNRTLTLVNYQGELAFGQEREPARALATEAEFEQHWRQDKDAFAFMEIATYERLKKHLPMQEVLRDSTYVIARKPQ